MKFKCYFVVGLLFFSLSAVSNQAEDRPNGYAVASAHPLATTAGLEILAKGGNAFDAAIAVSSVLGVVAAYHSGLGGGSYWLLYDATHKKNLFVDAREVAPLAATKSMYQNDKGEIVPGLSLNGGLAAAIPGQAAAFAYVARQYGRLPLSESLQPAIELAEQGFAVDHHFVSFIQMGDRLKQIKRFPGSAAVFLKNGQTYKIGEVLKQPDLAKTLKILAKQGRDGFYKGEIAEQLVKAVRQAGGIWTLKDLSEYRLKIREPLISAYGRMLIITAPPSSAGGVDLITMLNILSLYPLDSLSELKKVHYIVEAMRLAFWQRNRYLADPDFVDIPLKKLLSIENARSLARFILKDKATPSDALPDKTTNSSKQLHTSHISILDSEGNRVALTQTINFIFGSSVVAEGTGVLLNDEMDDFSSKPGVKNVFGIVGSEVNAIAPGKRPLSSMTPTFLEMPDRLAIVGTPGGSRIATMVLLASLSFYEYHGAISMVSKMRFHHQYLPDRLQFEPESFSPDLQQQLKAMGYELQALKQYYGDMQAISWDKKNRLITAVSDPRNIGLAVVQSDARSGYGLNH